MATLRRFWFWCIEPSPKIIKSDQRRQATLLMGFLLSLIILAIAIETVTAFIIDWTGYTGYRQTIVIVVLLTIVYGISRSQHIQLAATIAVVFTSLAIFASGWAEPRGVLGGLFDFLILPLWLGSLFIDLKRLPFLIASILVGLLLFPLAVPEVPLNSILVGPFIFVVTTSVMLLVITHHRNKLEDDRQAELLAKEQQSRREVARADALLRVADRLNAQLDLEAVLAAIGEEVARALNTPVSVVTLYDREHKHLVGVAGVGIPAEFIKDLPPFPRAVYDQTIHERGPVFTLADLSLTMYGTYLNGYKHPNLRSIAFARMEYEHELIGSLSAITTNEQRDFTKDELLLLQGLADQAALAIVNTRLYKDARQRLERLQALRTIDIAIVTNRDLQQNLEVLLAIITKQLKVDAAVFLLLNEQREQLEFATSIGFQTPTLRFTRLRLGEGMAGQAAVQRNIIHIADLHTDPQTLAYAPTLAKEGFISYYAAPLIAQGSVKGVLEIFHRSALKPDEEWLYFLEALADQAAIAIENTTLFDDFQQANDELSQAYDSTIEGWSRALDLRDRETEGHTQRVAQMTLRLAQRMGLSDDELVHVRRGALLHDIGKMGVPDQILLKPGKLTAEEWKVMQKHPTYAYDLLSPIAYLRPALDIPYYHHEKWDGTGYPHGLKAEQIPFAARLFALVDVWDALLSDRPYRPGWPIEQIVDHIRAQSGTHFDPNLVEVFLSLIAEA